jgi:hypothetical protein
VTARCATTLVIMAAARARFLNLHVNRNSVFKCLQQQSHRNKLPLHTLLWCILSSLVVRYLGFSDRAFRRLSAATDPSSQRSKEASRVSLTVRRTPARHTIQMGWLVNKHAMIHSRNRAMRG